MAKKLPAAKKLPLATQEESGSRKPARHDRPRCFVIMPFNPYLDEYYHDIYAPAIEEAGCIPIRADKITRRGQITEHILEETSRATFVLADVTGRNANVFYELGLAQALAKPAIILTQEIDEAPFDISGLRLMPYDTKRTNWNERLKREIVEAAREVLKNPAESIPVMFLKLKENRTQVEVTPDEKYRIETNQKIDQLRHEIYQLNRPHWVGVLQSPDEIRRSEEWISKMAERALKRLVKANDRDKVFEVMQELEEEAKNSGNYENWESVIQNTIEMETDETRNYHLCEYQSAYWDL